MRSSISVVIGLALLGACSSGRTVDISAPGMQALLALPLPEMSAKIRMAQRIASDCDRYAMNADLLRAIPLARPDAADGALEAIRARAGMDLLTDVEIRSFQARHNVTVGQDNLCSAADWERANGSAIGTLLVPVPTT